MVLWSTALVLTFFSTLIQLNLVHNEHTTSIDEEADSKNKSNSINNKIDKIARDILTNPSSDKTDLFNNLKEKLEKAAQHLGPKGKKHVELIMKGIKLKANSLKGYVRSYNTTNYNDYSTNSNNDNEFVNREIVDKLIEKINSLISTELEKLKETDEKNHILNDIKNRLLASVSAKQQGIFQSNENKTNHVNDTNNSDIETKIYKNNNTERVLEDYENINQINTNAGRKRFQSVTASPVCADVYDRICLELKNMNTLKCLYDDIIVPLDTLCNGKYDCPDRSDEKFCGSQAVERMQYSNWVITNIKTYLSHKCFDMNETKSVMSKRTQIIHEVLQTQEDFKEKYKNLNYSSRNIDKEDLEHEANMKTKANEIAIIISSLALTLDGAVCSDKLQEFQSRRHFEIVDNNLDKVLSETSWPPQNCSCDKEKCFKNSTNSCERICWQKNSVSRWNCDSINGASTVSLDCLCDGKLDCYDESDERDCVIGQSHAKFEAHKIYSVLLKMINLKALKARPSIKKKLLHLRNLIVELQEVAVKEVPSQLAVRTVRDICYSLLRTIYSNILEESLGADETEDAYMFLLTVNDHLGAALKRSHTGNTRIIAEGCYCKNGLCAQMFCSKVCMKACPVESKLMRYRCKNSNVTVSVDEICNGKENCPNGFDERNCKTEEVCRRHHLIVLRNNLQEVGSNLKGTALGELLKTWKTKVISMVKVAENNGRPTSRSLRNLVKDILSDLLVTYGSVESYRRRNNNYAFTEFVNIARVVMESLKSCRK